MSSIVVVGGGGHAKVVISILRKLNRYRIIGYSDLKDNGTLLGAPYLGTDEALSPSALNQTECEAVLAVGQVGFGTSRCELWMRLRSLSLSFPFIVSPDAIVNEGVKVDGGVTVMDGAIVNSGATIGYGAIVNTHSIIEHDVILADWVHVAPGATVCGGVKVGRYSMIGAGATVIEGLAIAEHCLVGAGSTIVEDITEPGVYVGSPARRIR